ncbi:MAG: outer membrane lipoprotein carrier protein LolA [Syntrophaceae bacterium]|nr:outer membrane lipoprotein carrier protein LolA [Deltaproteobacteria bacterium]
MQAKWKSSAVALVVLLGIAGAAYAVDLSRVQQRYSQVHEFTALFSQDTFQAIANKQVHFTGRISYKKGAGVRMDVLSPQRQVLILKGQTVVIILPDEGTSQVQEIPKEISTQNILGFFTGLASIEDRYSVAKDGDSLVLKPREGAGTITVWVDRDNLISRILLKDATGNASDIRLSGYRFNRALSDDLFKAGLPGRDVVPPEKAKGPSGKAGSLPRTAP